MITTLMPHLRIGPYKEGVLIDQIQMLFYPIVLSWTLLPYELLVVYTVGVKKKFPLSIRTTGARLKKTGGERELNGN